MFLEFNVARPSAGISCRRYDVKCGKTLWVRLRLDPTADVAEDQSRPAFTIFCLGMCAPPVLIACVQS